jgi:3-deoxy-D-manno-octulosonate 8-phosphate phosphatase (KDO 8-P phosphatase)
MIVLIDFDGVLTDGKQFMDHRGEKMMFAVHSRDNRAIRELIANGYRVIIVTANDAEFIKFYADKVGAEYLHARNKGNLEFENYIAIGDDVWDVPMLKKAKKAFCPSDADSTVLNLACVKPLGVKGGHGVIAELVRNIL